MFHIPDILAHAISYLEKLIKRVIGKTKNVKSSDSGIDSGSTWATEVQLNIRKLIFSAFPCVKKLTCKLPKRTI